MLNYKCVVYVYACMYACLQAFMHSYVCIHKCSNSYALLRVCQGTCCTQYVQPASYSSLASLFDAQTTIQGTSLRCKYLLTSCSPRAASRRKELQAGVTTHRSVSIWVCREHISLSGVMSNSHHAAGTSHLLCLGSLTHSTPPLLHS